MISVKFGEKDSYTDWGLLLKPKERPFPSPKTNYVSIEGRDGDLDLTTSLTGDVKYENVEFSLEFYLMDKKKDWETKLQEISTYLHGKKMNVIFSDDPDWYYVGRMTINELSNDMNVGSIAIDCNFEPYKLKVEETVITEAVTANKVITLSNTRKWVMPTFKTTTAVQFTYEGATYNVNGTLKTPNIILKEGETTITLVSGSGNIVISYREGKL